VLYLAKHRARVVGKDELFDGLAKRQRDRSLAEPGSQPGVARSTTPWRLSTCCTGAAGFQWLRLASWMRPPAWPFHLGAGGDPRRYCHARLGSRWPIPRGCCSHSSTRAAAPCLSRSCTASLVVRRWARRRR
jgi:hypothetical protein